MKMLEKMSLVRSEAREGLFAVVAAVLAAVVPFEVSVEVLRAAQTYTAHIA